MAARRVGVLAGALALLLPAAGAWADAIDGNWCSSDGRRIIIEGPRIVTPRGTRTTGDYDRHAFRYTVPASEPDAGTEINMDLLDEYTMQLSVGPPTAAPAQLWRRCAPATS